MVSTKILDVAVWSGLPVSYVLGLRLVLLVLLEDVDEVDEVDTS